MDLNKLSQGERLLAIVGGALVVLSFIPFWASYGAFGVSQRVGAWSAAFPFYVKLAVILAIAGVVLALIRAAGTELTLPVPYGLAYVGAMGIATLLLLIAVLAGPTGSGLPGVSRGILLFVSPLLAGAATWGGYQHMAEEGPAPGASQPPQQPPQQPPAS